MDKELNKFENSNHNYTEADLDKDIDSYIDERLADAIKNNTGSVSFLEAQKNSSALEKFKPYSNNFHQSCRWISEFLNEDGSIQADLESTDPLKLELIELNHLQDIYEIIKELGYEPSVFKKLTAQSSHMPDEGWEIIRKIWIGMRQKGYERIELI